MTEDKVNKMSLLACISYVIGNVIGSGIFITPHAVLARTQSIGLSLIMWLACGLISLLGAISFIELGTGIRTDGGDFAYVSFVGWNSIAFVFMVISCGMTFPASMAIQATTFGEYMVAGLRLFIDIDQGTVLERIIAFGILIGCTYLNCYALDKLASRFQIVVTVAKGLVLLTVIAIGAYHYFILGTATGLQDPMKGSNFEVSNLIFAAYGGLWSYAGWDILNYGAPSMSKPRRDMPLSLIGGLSVVTITYLAINASYGAVLGTQGIMNSTAVAADFAEVTMGNASSIVPFATAVLFMGTINSDIFCCSRIMCEAAKQGHLPKCLSAVHKKHKSPRVALIAQALVAAVFMFVSVETLINSVTFVMWAQKLVTMFALLKIRFENIQLHPGVLRVPLPIILMFTFCCALLVVIPFYSDPVPSLIGLVVVLIAASGHHFLSGTSIQLPESAERLNNKVCRLLGCVMQEVQPMEVEMPLAANKEDAEAEA